MSPLRQAPPRCPVAPPLPQSEQVALPLVRLSRSTIAVPRIPPREQQALPLGGPPTSPRVSPLRQAPPSSQVALPLPQSEQADLPLVRLSRSTIAVPLLPPQEQQALLLRSGQINPLDPLGSARAQGNSLKALGPTTILGPRLPLPNPQPSALLLAEHPAHGPRARSPQRPSANRAIPPRQIGSAVPLMALLACSTNRGLDLPLLPKVQQTDPPLPPTWPAPRPPRQGDPQPAPPPIPPTSRASLPLPIHLSCLANQGYPAPFRSLTQAVALPARELPAPDRPDPSASREVRLLSPRPLARHLAKASLLRGILDPPEASQAFPVLAVQGQVARSA